MKTGIDITGLVWAFFLSLFWFLLYRYFKQNRSLKLVFSTFPLFLNKKKSFKERFSNLPHYLLFAAGVLALLALVNPHLLIQKKPDAEEEFEARGLAIYLILDNSTSMHYKVLAKSPSGKMEEIEKIDLSKRVAKQFVAGDKDAGLKGRKGDAIGLVAFARVAKILSPLTLDHAKILEEIDRIEYNKDIRQVGSGIGYAIYKTTATIKATLHFSKSEGASNYDIKNPILILVTDGINEVNPEDENNPLRSMDVWKAAEFAKENNVKVYMINIDPSFNDKTYTELYTLITKYTGGNFFLVNSSKNLQEIYKEIDQNEKSKIPLFAKTDKEVAPPVYDTMSFSPYLLILAIICLFLAIALEAFFFKRLP